MASAGIRRNRNGTRYQVWWRLDGTQGRLDRPQPRLDPEQVFGHQRRRTLTPEEFGHLLAACRPFYRDHFLIQIGTGLRSGELLGLRRRRVFPELGRIEVIEVRYEAGRFGRGFKAEPKSLASVRVVPMCDQAREAIARQLAGVARPEDLALPGPGGSNGIPRGARAPLSTSNLRRVYKAAVEAAGDDLAHLDLRGPHDLRHTFATWLEDAAIPSRVIDELMGHASGRRDRGAGATCGVLGHGCWRIAGGLRHERLTLGGVGACQKPHCVSITRSSDRGGFHAVERAASQAMAQMNPCC
jgi:integrase